MSKKTIYIHRFYQDASGDSLKIKSSSKSSQKAWDLLEKKVGKYASNSFTHKGSKTLKSSVRAVSKIKNKWSKMSKHTKRMFKNLNKKARYQYKFVTNKQTVYYKSLKDFNYSRNGIKFSN